MSFKTEINPLEFVVSATIKAAIKTKHQRSSLVTRPLGFEGVLLDVLQLFIDSIKALLAVIGS